ncbi:sugar ABC transporter substrate-binding protein [Leucobacter sp. gxy201]|uniref:sugar ABC transporter substrate-binding protein n=1 Tax=Leucobacter sp. gxy201 TaxID=2957200 RepID=UPI003DA0383A
MKFKKTAGAVLLAGALALTGCAGGGDGGDSAASNEGCEQVITVGFSHPSGDDAYVVALKGAVERYAAQEECVELLLDNTQLNNLEDQRATIENWVTQKVDAIVMTPVDAAALEDLREAAQAQGTKWISYAEQLDGTDGSAGFDSDSSGRDAGAYAVEWLERNELKPGEVTVGLTTSPLDAFDGRNIFAKEVLEEAGYEVVSYQECNNTECGLQIAQDALRENPDLRVFIGVSDDAGVGAIRAFEESNVDIEEVLIMGHNGSLEALEAIKSGGPFRATLALPLDELAESILVSAVNSVKGEGETHLATPAEVVSQDDQTEVDRLIAMFG